MAKRKSTSTTGPQAKRVQQDKPAVKLTDTQSIQEQAEPYRLGTVKFPINALTRIWSIGSNRPLDTRHVQALCQRFEEQHLQRELPEHHLRVACSQDEFKRMMDHIENIGQSTELWPSFDMWMLVNESKAELIGGQHRVEALRLLLSRISRRPGGSAIAKDQAWWICDVYDKGKSSHRKPP